MNLTRPVSASVAHRLRRVQRARRSRSRTDEGADLGVISPAPRFVDGVGEHAAAGVSPETTILGLQRIHGNQHVARLLVPPRTVQRLPIVREGSRGDAVEELQERLNRATPAPEPPLIVDGIAGPKTRAAVVAFQRQNGLAPDGIVGPLTWGVLTGRKSAPAPETAPGPKPPAAAKQEQVGSDGGTIASAVESVIAGAFDAVASEPSGGALPPNFVEQELNAFFEEFAAVPVTIRGTPEKAVIPPRTLRVHTPYFINIGPTSKEMSKKVHAAAMTARAKKTVRSFFEQVAADEALSGKSDRALIGKATPQHIQGILQAALDQGIIRPQDADHPTADELRVWLRTHGVGVDCSGFVSYALTHVVEKSRHKLGLEGPVEAIYKGSAGLKGGAKGFAKVGADKSCTGPKCLKSGDTMHITGHIRIVSKVESRDGGVEFTTLESYAGGSERVGMAEARWFYPDEDKFSGLKVKRGEGSWTSTKEKPTFGRLETLADLTE